MQQMTEMELYCRRDVEMTDYMDLWWDVFHWVKKHYSERKTMTEDQMICGNCAAEMTAGKLCLSCGWPYQGGPVPARFQALHEEAQSRCFDLSWSRSRSGGWMILNGQSKTIMAEGPEATVFLGHLIFFLLQERIDGKPKRDMLTNMLGK